MLLGNALADYEPQDVSVDVGGFECGEVALGDADTAVRVTVVAMEQTLAGEAVALPSVVEWGARVVEDTSLSAGGAAVASRTSVDRGKDRMKTEQLG